MIKLTLMRHKNRLNSSAYTKTTKNLQRQILKGINSSPYAETQLLTVKIKDKPVKRFFGKLLELPEEIVRPEIIADFTRAHKENGLLTAKKYHYTDTFTAEQAEALRNGKNLLKEDGNFIQKLNNFINKSITE